MTAPERPEDAVGGVIVGVGDSPDGTEALAWATANADGFGPVIPVLVQHLPALLATLADRGVGPDPALYRAAAETRLAEAIATVEPAQREGLTARARVVEGRPGPVLCELAEGAELLVVGTRGRSGVAASLLGSVSSHCVRHATCPVAVIPPSGSPPGRPRRVAVGLDGSASARHALRWALDHTDPDGLVLAVTAAPMWGYSVGPGAPTDEERDAEFLALAEASVAEVVGERRDGPDVEIWTDRRDARVALRDLPGDPVDLLVVGARGLSEVPFLLLGSVSSALAHHPVVPTVIVRTDQPTTEEVATS